MTNLNEVFDALAQKYRPSSKRTKQLWKELEMHYQAADRHYHNFQHLEMLLKELLAVKNQIEDWDSLLWALFYHDFVYNVQRKDNELKSAEYAKLVLEELDCPIAQINRCVQHILATKDHGNQWDSDTSFFVDADLSILGQNSLVYKTYTQQIRQEYQVFPDEVYGPGRQKVVHHFLAMERIFKCDFFYEKYEKQARINLLEELSKLD